MLKFMHLSASVILKIFLWLYSGPPLIREGRSRKFLARAITPDTREWEKGKGRGTGLKVRREKKGKERHIYISSVQYSLSATQIETEPEKAS